MEDQTNYVPVVGDVVEVTCRNGFREPAKALIYRESDKIKYIRADGAWGLLTNLHVSTFKKIGEYSGTPTSYMKASAFAKAYFASPVFKVGDRVESVLNGVTFYRVIHTLPDGKVQVKSDSGYEYTSKADKFRLATFTADPDK